MEAFKKNLKNIFYFIFGIIFIYLIFNVLFNNSVNLFKTNGFIVLGCSIVNIFILFLLYKFIYNRKKINEIKVLAIVFLFITIFQLIFGYLFRVKPTWDFGNVYNAAISSANGIQAISDNDYFYIYSNNNIITYMFKVIYKICGFLHIYNYNVIGMIVNMVFIDIAILFVYLIAKKIFGVNKALILLFALSIFTPIYTYIPIFYTDTISMPFIAISLYFYLLFEKEDDKFKRILYILLTSVFAFVGMSLKFTAIIVIIAIIIARMLNNSLKSNLKFLIALIIPIMLLFSLQNIITSNLFEKDKLDSMRIPFTHWVMMGLRDNGGFNEEDFQNTFKCPNKTEKQEYNIAEIKNRIKGHIQNGTLLKFYTNKLVYVWGDGTYFAPEKLRREPVNKGLHHEFVLNFGKYSIIYGYIAQIQHVTLLILIFISLFNVKNKDNKEYQNIRFISTLSIFGIMLFLLIWEARSRYIINFIPIFMITSLYGFDFLVNKFKNNCYKELNEKN